MGVYSSPCHFLQKQKPSPQWLVLRQEMQPCGASNATSFLLFIRRLMYLNDRGLTRDMSLHLVCERETRIVACLLWTTASCHLTGGVWASLPISPFRNSIICLFWDIMTGFLAAGACDHSTTNNKKGRYLSQQTGSSSCSLAWIPLLLCDSCDLQVTECLVHNGVTNNFAEGMFILSHGHFTVQNSDPLV